MSKTIDQRVVEMQFDNKNFESNVATTMSTLDKLKKSLEFKGAEKGLEGIETAARKCDVSPIGAAAEKVGLKFSAMYTMADQALRNITNSAMFYGKRIVSALTIDPIKTGFQEYETQINAIQTILANTESKGTTLDDVNGALDELNAYADKTIYNFTEMTRNIGTFTAAGTDLDTSVKAIKGIANLAAVSGSTSHQASTAMYQLSQAMASGTVKLMDWNSVVNAGMGGQVFQEALKDTARVHGIAIDDIIAKQGSFRESLSEGWLTTEILTDTLEKFTMYAEEGSEEWENYKKTLMEKGYTSAQAEEILKMGKTATEAATKVKTFTQLFDTLKEAAQSGWTQTWEILVGDFEEAKELLTSISDTIGALIGKSAESRNELLENWKVMGGRDDLIESFKNIWEALLSVIKPVKEAFNDIFPPATAEQLVKITKSLKDFTAKLKLSDKGAENLKRTFKGVFAVFKLAGTIISAAAKAIFKLFDGARDLGGGLLGVTAVVGDFLSFIVELITYGNIFEKVFNGVSCVINLVAKGISVVISWLATAFEFLGNGVVFPGITILVEGLKKIIDSFSGVENAAGSFKDKVAGAFSAVGEALMKNPIFKFMTKLWDLIKAIGKAIGNFVSKVFGGLINKLTSGDFVGILEIINGLIASGIGVGLFKLIKSIKEMFDGVGDIAGGFKKVLSSVSGSLRAFQNDLNAEAIKKLAVAIAILAAAVLVLSFIDSEKLTDAVAVITVLFANMMGSMAVLSKSSGITNVGAMTLAMIGLSTGILILSSALKSVASLNIEQVGTGIVGIMALMATLVFSMKILGKQVSKDQKIVYMGIMQTIALALAAKILASILLDLAKLDWDDLAKGVIGLVTVMATLVGAMKILPLGTKNIAKPFFQFCTQMYIVAKSAKMLAGTLIDISYLDWDELAIGSLGMLGCMTMLIGAMKILPLGTKNINANAIYSLSVAMAALAVSVRILVPAIKEFGDMDWEELGKAGTAFAGLIGFFSLFAVSVKMVKTNDILKAAGSIAIASASLLILAGAMKIFVGMSWEQLGKAGTVLAGIVATISLLSLVSMYVKPGKINAMAASMVILAAALNMLIVPLTTFAAFNWGMIAKAGTVLGGLVASLALLGLISKYVNPVALILTATSLAILAASLQLLVIPLSEIGLMKWETLGKGLLVLAGAFVVLGIAGRLLAPIATSILTVCAALALLGASMTLIGVGLGFIGVGLVSFSAGLTALGASLVAVVWSIIEVCTILIEKAVEMLGRWIAAICKVVIEGAPLLGEAVIAVVLSLLDVLMKCGPSLIETCLVLIGDLLKALVEYVPGIADSLFELLVLVLGSLRKFIPQLVDVLVDIVIAIVQGVSDKAPELIAAFINLFAVIFEGLAAALSNLDMTALLKGVAAVTVLALIFNKLASIKASMIPKAMIGLLGIGAIIAELAIILAAIGGIAQIPGFKWLVTEGGDLLAEMGVALLKAVPAFGAVALLLVAATAIGPLIAPAMLGLLGLGAIVAEMALVLAAIGVLAQIPGLTWLIGEGGNFLQSIGTAIGQFVGGIIGGVAQGITSSFPQIGTDLSNFMTNLQPFIDGAKTIDPSVVEGVNSIVGVILAITGANVLQGLASWITGGSSISTFSDELPALGQGIKSFSDSVVGVNTEAVVSAANAAKVLAEMTNCIPNEGGVVGWFAGENSISKFASELPTLGEGLKGFSDAVSGVNPEVITSAATAAKTLAEMTNAIPNEGGVVSWFAGDNSISKFAGELTTLGEGLSGFSSALVGVNPETITAAAQAGKTLVEMTQNIPNEGGVVSWFAGENSVSKFAGELVTLGAGLKGFSDATVGVNPEVVTAAANAAKTLADMTSTIPNEGGVVSWFVGENSISKFAGDLPALGSGLKGFSDSVNGINQESVTAAANAGKTLADMASTIPNEGGVVAWFAGENSISKFAGELTTLGNGIKGFSDATAGVSSESMIAAANAAKSLAEMTTHIPTEGGIKAWFSGESSIANFANKLPTLGEGIKGFSDAVAGLNAENTTAAANAASALAEMTTHIPKEGGIKAWFTGETNVADFAGKLPTLGEGLKGFSDSVAGIVPENVTSAANAAKSLAQMTETVPKNTSKIIDFGDNLSTFGDKLASYFEKTAGVTSESTKASSNAIKAVKDITSVDTGKLKTVANSIDDVGTSIKNLSKVPGDILSKFTKSLKSLGESSVKSFKKEFEKLDDDMKDVGEDAMTAFKKGVDDRRSKAIDSCKKIAEKCVDAIKDKKSSFESAGKAIAQGLADGISKNSYLAEAKAKAMAEAAEKAAKEALDINSPSKVFTDIGYGVPEGFAIGIDSLGNLVKRSVENMTDDSIDGVKNSISRIADIVNSDIDSQPTIRPVLDLSEVRNGASKISSLFNTGASVSLMGNVGAISSIMAQKNQNGVNDDVVSAIDKLNKNLENAGDTYNFGNISYDDGSAIAEAVQALIRAALIERRV